MPVGRTQDERKAETRQRLLQAAGELIAERGVAGASVDALAEAADRTSGAIYAHFGGKEGLLVALLDEWKDALSVAVRAEFEAASDERERIGSLWQNFVSPPPGTGDAWTLLEHELWLYACRNPEVRPILAARYDAARRAFGSALPAALDARESADVAGLLIALLLGLEMQRRLDPDAVSDETAVAALQALLRLPETAERV
jgi:AcrR family transcriptional regulator